MAKTKSAKKKPSQGKIPGTERKEISDLTDAAEALREAKEERAEVTSRIHDAQAHLDATVTRLIESGELVLPDKFSFHKEVIYTYDREDGKVGDVKYTSKSKTDVAEHKGSASAGEDE